MSDVTHQAPPGQECVTCALSWSDPKAARQWLTGVQVLLDDAMAVMRDQMLPHRQRKLGHAEAERIIREADRALGHALSYAARSLPPSP